MRKQAVAEPHPRHRSRSPSACRLVLQLHYVEGLTYKEIAGMLDVSEPRICQLHADAIAKVRAAMGV